MLRDDPPFGTDRLRLERFGHRPPQFRIAVETFKASGTTTRWSQDHLDFVTTPGGWVRRMSHGPFTDPAEAKDFILATEHHRLYGIVPSPCTTPRAPEARS